MKPYFILFFILFIGCQKESQIIPVEECFFITPVSTALIRNDVPIELSVAASSEVQLTIFYFDNDSIGAVSGDGPFTWTPVNYVGGDHVISARIRLINGPALSCSVFVFVPYSFFERAQGGTIFSLDETGRHGLVVAPQDLTFSGEDKLVWGPETFMSATDTMDGNANTQTLAGEPLMESYFWNLFKFGYTHNGYSDWYVPSKTEFLLLAEHMDEFASTDPAFLHDTYWTSTECCRANACAVDFNIGKAITCLKADSLFRIRPVRKF